MNKFDAVINSENLLYLHTFLKLIGKKKTLVRGITIENKKTKNLVH